MDATPVSQTSKPLAPRARAASVRADLQAATHEAHERLHGWDLAQRLQQHDASLDDYRAYLMALYGARVQLDAVLEACGFAAGASEHKALAADLCDLGVDQPALDRAAHQTATLTLANPAQRMGAAYVVLGSTLGNRLLWQQLGKREASRRWPHRFIADMGGHQRTAWDKLLSDLDAHADTDDALHQMIAGANAVFAWLQALYFEDAATGTEQTA